MFIHTTHESEHASEAARCWFCGRNRNLYSRNYGAVFRSAVSSTLRLRKNK